MNAHLGGKIVFIVVGTVSIATLWRAWPRNRGSDGDVISRDARPLPRVLHTLVPLVLPIVFALSVLYCAVSLLQ